ncbi:MAG: peptidylprolyl isomerase [Gammaproteobacteria bacterium]|nr:peptidylprolyl isomerase [Gammaproteobacteria bacterium]
MKKLLSLFLLLLVAACNAETPNSAQPAPQTAAADGPRVLLQTNKGDILIGLYPDKAPQSVANFLRYVDEGFYDGTIFHRVIDGFMIQGGGFTPDMEKKPTRAPIINEADNGLRNITGTIAMARTMDPHSATSQFYINVANNSPLDFREKTPRAWGYAVFGRVLKGMDVVGAIKGTATTTTGMHRDVPQQPIIINKAERLNPAPASNEEPS